MWLLSQRTLSVILLSLDMKQMMGSNPGITFVNLKEFVTEYFIKHPFIFICDNPELVTANNTFNRNTVSLSNQLLEENIRFEDSLYPEYLYAIIINSVKGGLRDTIKSTDSNLKKIEYPKNLIRHKLLQLFDIILYKDFYTEKWWDKWANNKCYVIKRNGNLEYYTAWDYPKWLNNLLDWVTITYQVVNIDGKRGYKLILDFNV